jgi:hypothetical protein
MRSLKLLFIVIVCALLYSAYRALPQYELTAKIPLNGGGFTTDNLQNVYVYHRSTIKEYSSGGKLLYTYSDKSYGDITEVDANNPLKLMVFYKDFPQIVFLDNTLSQNGNAVNPSDLGFPLTSMACVSHDNGLWFYDGQNFQLVRFDVTLTLMQKTGNLSQQLGIIINPYSLQEYNSYVYLNDTAKGILVFDSFGTYFKTIPFKHITSYQIRGDNLFYMLKNKIHSFDLKTIMEDVTIPPDSLVSQVRIEKNLLYENCQDTIRVYSIK